MWQNVKWHLFSIFSAEYNKWWGPLHSNKEIIDSLRHYFKEMAQKSLILTSLLSIHKTWLSSIWVQWEDFFWLVLCVSLIFPFPSLWWVEKDNRPPPSTTIQVRGNSQKTIYRQQTICHKEKIKSHYSPTHLAYQYLQSSKNILAHPVLCSNWKKERESLTLLDLYFLAFQERSEIDTRFSP